MRDGGQVRVSAFLKCLLTVAALGAVLAFPASAWTGSESQTPSTGTTGSESQSPSTDTPGAQAQPQSQDAPTNSTPANPEASPASTTKEAQKPATPYVLIVVDKPTQTMTVTLGGHVRHVHLRQPSSSPCLSTRACGRLGGYGGGRGHRC
jgi:hypothetical protein